LTARVAVRTDYMRGEKLKRFAVPHPEQRLMSSITAFGRKKAGAIQGFDVSATICSGDDEKIVYYKE
jgi:hypothetical protein